MMLQTCDDDAMLIKKAGCNCNLIVIKTIVLEFETE